MSGLGATANIGRRYGLDRLLLIDPQVRTFVGHQYTGADSRVQFGKGRFFQLKYPGLRFDRAR